MRRSGGRAEPLETTWNPWTRAAASAQAGAWDLDLSLFDEVGDARRGMAPPELGELHYRAHRYGIKVWFGTEAPPREHYEAQVVGAKEVKQAKVHALEVGFHSEYPKSVASWVGPTSGGGCRKRGPIPISVSANSARNSRPDFSITSPRSHPCAELVTSNRARSVRSATWPDVI